MDETAEILLNPTPSYPGKRATTSSSSGSSRRRRHQMKQKKFEEADKISHNDNSIEDKESDSLFYKILNHFYGKSPAPGTASPKQSPCSPPSISPSIRDENGGLMRTPLSTSQRRYVQSHQSLISQFIPLPRSFSEFQSGNTSPSLSLTFINNLFSHGTSSRDYFFKCISNIINTVSTGVYNGITSNINALNSAINTMDTTNTPDTNTPNIADNNTENKLQGILSTESRVTMEELAKIIKSGCSVLFVTGAGVSVGSGVPTYRTGEDGIWKKYIYEWGTKEKFLSDPTTWWNDFWFKTHDINPERVLSPCAAHYAITDIMREYPNVNLVTQNVDRLHLKSGADPSRVIEIHGAMDVYRCSNRSCKYASEECIEGVVFEKSEDGNVIPPHCPNCGAYVLPMTLLFDELYSSHSFFRKKTFQDWLDRADVVVFVGTSFSVNVTLEVLRVAALWDTEIFNFNLEPKRGYGIKNIMGPSEVLLPELARETGVTMTSAKTIRKKQKIKVWSIIVTAIFMFCMLAFLFFFFFVFSRKSTFLTKDE